MVFTFLLDGAETVPVSVVTDDAKPKRKAGRPKKTDAEKAEQAASASIPAKTATLGKCVYLPFAYPEYTMCRSRVRILDIDKELAGKSSGLCWVIV